jgi:hypothetical protein
MSEGDSGLYWRVLVRVAYLIGGVDALAAFLKVPYTHLKLWIWIEGRAPVPKDVFLRCVDYLLDHRQSYFGTSPFPPLDLDEKGEGS